MGTFERYLSLWVALAIGSGVLLGMSVPAAFQTIASIELAHVNLVVALLIWVMIYPMMLQIDFAAMRDVGRRPKGLVLTLVVNWLIKPFTMAALGLLFFKVIFAPLVDPQSANEYIAGMILLGVAPCTAMVFVWSQLTKGDPNYTLVQVSINDVIMIFAFAPLAALLLGVTDVQVPWQTLLLSTLLYVVLPLMAGVVSRDWLINRSALPAASENTDNQNNEGERAVGQLVTALKPWSIVGLLATVTLLFGFQATKILANPLVIVLIAIPLILQTYGIYFITLVGAHYLKLSYAIAAPACLIGTSNFFELAVAVAISLFGLDSGAALATVVGVLVEVPVMLSLVAFSNSHQHWFVANE